MDLSEFGRDICIGFEITRGCNMRCSYCYVRTRKSEEELEINDWFKLADIFREKFGDSSICFHLAGGEIFVKRGVEELIGYLAEQGCLVSVVSNGLNIPAEIYANDLLKSNKGCFTWL